MNAADLHLRTKSWPEGALLLSYYDRPRPRSTTAPVATIQVAPADRAQLDTQCREDLEQLEQQVGRVLMPFEVYDARIEDPSWLERGLGTRMYTDAIEHVAQKDGALIASTCFRYEREYGGMGEDATTQAALRVWESRELAKSATVRGLVATMPLRLPSPRSNLELKSSLMPPPRHQNDALADARARLLEGEIVVDATLTVQEAWTDDAARQAIEAEDSRSFDAAKLAQDAGFDVRVKVQEWEHGEIFTTWQVSATPALERELAALVWDGKKGDMEYTLTRSTRHPGWQLTSWARDGGPWGHADIEGPISDAFDTDLMASGVALRGLVQVVFRDGRVLVRRGAEPIALNPSVAGAPRARRRRTA